jgi:hypothetical protein
MKLSVPKGESPVSGGVVPGSKASGKLVWSDSYSEVGQTAVSILILVSAEVITTIRCSEVAIDRSFPARLYHKKPSKHSQNRPESAL